MHPAARCGSELADQPATASQADCAGGRRSGYGDRNRLRAEVRRFGVGAVREVPL